MDTHRTTSAAARTASRHGLLAADHLTAALHRSMSGAHGKARGALGAAWGNLHLADVAAREAGAMARAEAAASTLEAAREDYRLAVTPEQYERAGNKLTAAEAAAEAARDAHAVTLTGSPVYVVEAGVKGAMRVTERVFWNREDAEMYAARVRRSNSTGDYWAVVTCMDTEGRTTDGGRLVSYAVSAPRGLGRLGWPTGFAGTGWAVLDGDRTHVVSRHAFRSDALEALAAYDARHGGRREPAAAPHQLAAQLAAVESQQLWHREHPYAGDPGEGDRLEDERERLEAALAAATEHGEPVAPLEADRRGVA